MCNHKSPSYKVHDHPHTERHIYIYICMYVYIHTYIMHNAITQSRKVKKTLPKFQGYGPVRYKKCKIDIAIPRKCDPSKDQELKMGYMEGDPKTLEKRLREKEKEKTTLEGLGPLIY